MLGDGGGDQPPPFHLWGGCLITYILQETWPEDWITEAMFCLQGRPSYSLVGAPRMRGFPIAEQEVLSLAKEAHSTALGD